MDKSQYYFPEEKSFFELRLLGRTVPPWLVIAVGVVIIILFHDWMGFLIGLFMLVAGVTGLIAQKVKRGK